MIIFKRLSFANFLSVGNQPVTVDLDNCKTTLIHGTNGSGKSTILDALTYSLFGKSFRGVNLGQLVNTQNKKGLLVECEFSIGKNRFLVRRGQKPKLFEVYKNDELIDAKAADKDNQAFLENNILKLTYKSFTQIVILGSSNFVPFMQLNSAGRRDCVEDFLDIKVFSAMAMLAKDRLRALKERKSVVDMECDNLEWKIDTIEDKIKSMTQKDESAIEDYNAEIRDHESQISRINSCLGQWYEDIKVLTEEMDDVERLGADKQIRQLNTVIVKLNTKLERLAKERDFFDQDECPTCGQGIESALKNGAQSRIQKEMEEVDKASIQAGQMMLEQEKIFDRYKELNNRMVSFNNSVFELQTELKGHNTSISTLKDYITKVKGASGDVDKEKGVLKELARELAEKKKEKGEMVEHISSHQTVVDLLKDGGIKTQVVKKYLPAMNKYIRYYLGELDFPIHFQLNTEFNEQINSPRHQDFSYQSFSEGQKGRIDLALMFCWREIGRLKNSVSTNLLILDEVFSSSLDEVGKECLMTLLRYRLPDNQRVLVVDHTLSEAFKDKFDHSVEVSLVNGFSRYS